jgi:hypothetical protein
LVERYLTSNGFNPRTVGRNFFDNKSPLKSVTDLMNQCSGTVVIAFERLHIESGEEQRGSSKSIPLADVTLPTAWNQVEAGMAYVLGQPLFVLVEHSLRCDALLQDGNEWYVTKVDLDPSVLITPEFVGVFSGWKKSVENFHQKSKLPIDTTSSSTKPVDCTLAQILKSLTPSQYWAILGAIITVLTGIAVAAYNVGNFVAKKDIPAVTIPLKTVKTMPYSNKIG